MQINMQYSRVMHFFYYTSIFIILCYTVNFNILSKDHICTKSRILNFQINCKYQYQSTVISYRIIYKGTSFKLKSNKYQRNTHNVSAWQIEGIRAFLALISYREELLYLFLDIIQYGVLSIRVPEEYFILYYFRILVEYNLYRIS